jgi:hypothetical protein
MIGRSTICVQEGALRTISIELRWTSLHNDNRSSNTSPHCKFQRCPINHTLHAHIFSERPKPSMHQFDLDPRLKSQCTENNTNAQSQGYTYAISVPPAPSM